MAHRPKKHSTIKFVQSSTLSSIPPTGNVQKYIPQKTFYPIGSTVEHLSMNGINMTCKYYKCLHSLHSPALVKSNGDQIWYNMGEIHRDGGPAVTKANGDKYWYQHNILHRDDGPAIELANGQNEFYQNGIKIE